MRLFFKQHVFEVEEAKDFIKILSKSQEPYLLELNDLYTKWFDNELDFKVQTSGSTGNPKFISLTKSNMRKSASLTISTFGLHSSDTLWLCLPLSSIAGIMMLIRSIVLNSDLVVSRPKANPYSDIPKGVNIDFSAITPYQAKKSIEQLKAIPKIIIGGAPISRDLEEALLEGINETNNELYQTYGMTETITHVAIRKLNYQGDKYFQALDGISFSTDKRSCLRIKAEHLGNSLFQTNDIVQLSDNTSFEYVGRYDEIINSGGIKINPQKIENKLSGFIKERFFISAEENDDFGQIAILIVESKKNKTIYEELLNAVDFDVYHKPKKVYTTAEFKTSHTNKVDKIQTLKKLDDQTIAN
ncbi:MAG: O-succinylbenzoic acid--CoA ligase [Flavobacteriaceae bacterium]|nr:O-succinylbenzoic acid--CoA ligase [Flavobacteriaceae bacterium]